MDKSFTQLTKSNKSLFWDIPEGKISDLSNEAVIERLVNYGDFDTFKKIFQVMNIEVLVDVFKTILNKKRSNIRPAAANYVKIFIKNNYGEDI